MATLAFSATSDGMPQLQLQATKERILSLENKLKNISWENEVFAGSTEVCK